MVFQSLFFWMTPIKPPFENLSRLLWGVSILVLLDDSHQERQGEYEPEDLAGFNPCSSG